MRKLALLLVLGAGCYGTLGYDQYGSTTYGGVQVAVAPPQPMVEVPTPAPWPGATWTAGYWDWRPDQRRYAWIGGSWVRPPQAGVVYLPPRWERGRLGWLRQPGRWVPGATRDRFGRRVWFDSLGRAHYL